MSGFACDQDFGKVNLGTTQRCVTLRHAAAAAIHLWSHFPGTVLTGVCLPVFPAKLRCEDLMGIA